MVVRYRCRGLWQLSGIVARRFSDLPYARYLLPVPGRRMIVRVMSFTTMAWNGWRAGTSGTAVCGLTGAPGPRRRAVAILAWSFIGLVFVVGWASWMAVWSALALMVVPVLTCLAFAGVIALMGWRATRVRRSKAKLAKLRAGAQRRVEVHMVASEEPGAGRALLAEVTAEADRNCWALTLEAANDRLAAYYQELGFEPIGPPTEMPYGERVTRMVRL